jgi:hydroxypyruvate isomerase
LGVKQLNCLVGIVPPGVTRRMRTVLVENLKFAADALKDEGIRLLVEPINTFDIPGFFLSNTGTGGGTDREPPVRTTCSSSTTSITCSAWKAS